MLQAYVFGGEGARLRLQQGLKVLDLMTNDWSELDLPADGKQGPEPRTALTATAYQDRCACVPATSHVMPERMHLIQFLRLSLVHGSLCAVDTLQCAVQATPSSVV